MNSKTVEKTIPAKKVIARPEQVKKAPVFTEKEAFEVWFKKKLEDEPDAKKGSTGLSSKQILEISKDFLFDCWQARTDVELVKEQISMVSNVSLAAHRVPAGYAIGPKIRGLIDNDIGFYITGPNINNQYTIKDDGLTVSLLQASGNYFSHKMHWSIFGEMIKKYAVNYNPENGELYAGPFPIHYLSLRAEDFMYCVKRVKELIDFAKDPVVVALKTLKTINQPLLPVAPEIIATRWVGGKYPFLKNQLI